LIVAGLALSATAAQAAKYAAIVVDAATGRTLHQTNADAPRYPASLTKMMTLYLTFEALEAKKIRLDQRIPVSARAAGMAPSRLGLRAGETLTVREAILALVTKSANDAAAVLGEALGGTESKFAVQMTKRAHTLGMSNTTFKNASGLPNPKQVTTARDMATLARALYRDFPQYYGYFKTPQFTFKGVTNRNHNRLIGNYEGTDGLKTGFIQASGFNLAASVNRDGHRLFGVVLGGETAGWRDARMMNLFEQAYDRTQPSASMVASATPARKPLPSLIASAQAAPIDRPDVDQGDSNAPGPMASLAVGDVPKPRATAASGWAIQVGAFSRSAAAHVAASEAKGKLPKTLKGAVINVSPGANLYRARLTGLSQRQAQSACKQLSNRGTACITISPAHSGAG
jgi:D-alanyl-D-alanine carboxypeptidase